MDEQAGRDFSFISINGFVGTHQVPKQIIHEW